MDGQDDTEGSSGRVIEAMGYYKDEPSRHRRGAGIWQWAAVGVVSAVVGSGATLFALSALESHSIPTLSPVESSSLTGPATPVALTVNDGVTQAVKKVKPAVMGVVNYAQVSNDFSQQTKLEPAGVGTGVLFHKDAKFGYAVTNNHVVQGAAKVDVVLGSGKHVQAGVVGTDPYTDLAVLKVPLQDVRNITPVRFANSDQLQAGEPAIAIGTPMGLDFADSVTAGIVSATKRIMPVQEPSSQQTLDYQTVIQTDAAINPGNSGGPLIDIQGNVIGINSSKIVAQNFEGMGFAIPANEAAGIASQIMQTGHAMHPSLGIEGYSLASLPQQWWPDVPVDYGVFIRAVTSGTARSSGLQPQDVVVGFNNHVVKTMADLRTYLFQTKPGDTAILRVYRGNRLMNLKLKIGSMETQNTTGQQSAPSDASLGGFFNNGF